MPVHRGQKRFDFIPRIDQDAFPCLLTTDDESVLEKRRSRGCLENHVGDVAEDADTGIVHENVESTEAGCRIVNRGFRGGGVLDVCGDGVNPCRA